MKERPTQRERERGKGRTFGEQSGSGVPLFGVAWKRREKTRDCKNLRRRSQLSGDRRKQKLRDDVLRSLPRFVYFLSVSRVLVS